MTGPSDFTRGLTRRVVLAIALTRACAVNGVTLTRKAVWLLLFRSLVHS